MGKAKELSNVTISKEEMEFLLQQSENEDVKVEDLEIKEVTIGDEDE